MRTRANWLIVAVSAAVIVSALPATAQIDRVRDPNWTTPRLPDGQPALQGQWGNKTITPIERPESETRRRRDADARRGVRLVRVPRYIGMHCIAR